MSVIAKSVPAARAYTTSGDLTVTIPTTLLDGTTTWTPAADEQVAIAVGVLSSTVDPQAPSGFTLAGPIVPNQWGAKVAWFTAPATSVTPGSVVTVPFSGAAQARACILWVVDTAAAPDTSEPGGNAATSTTPTWQAFTKNGTGNEQILDAGELRASTSNVAVSVTGVPAGVTVSDEVGTNDTTTASYRNGTLFTAHKWVTGTAVGESTATSNIATDWATTRIVFPYKSKVIGPTVNAGADQAREVSSAAFTITATENLNGGTGITARQWTQLSGPATALAGTATATVTITPPAAAGTSVYQYTATNSSGESGSDTVSVTFTSPGQTLRPNGDVSTGGWVATPAGGSLASKLDEVVPDAADYITSPDNPSGATYTGTLTPGVNPGTTSGVRLRVRLRVSTGTASHSVAVSLIQGPGSSVVATRTFTDLTTTAAWREVELSAAEVNAISDWSNLRWSVAATAS